jgi:alpha-beta hydrolase superfamily lysophospholipase
MSSTLTKQGLPVPAYPPLFGVRRPLSCPVPVRFPLKAGDGAELQLHHIAGGTKGPLILAPGTAMSALCYLTDTTEQSFAEFLAEKGFDIWLFDWRTSPYLPVHTQDYTFDDVARYDWPIAISFVREATGAERVSVLAHCLSSPCLMLSLLRGYTERAHLKTFVASQVGVHLRMNRANRSKVSLHVDKLLPSQRMVHQAKDTPREGLWDLTVAVVAATWPKSYSCDNSACHRQSATYGDIVYHPKINAETHALMGDLVPEVNSGFLKDVAPNSRSHDMLTDEDRRHLDRLDLPMLLISGTENQMFVPEATERTWRLLHGALGDHIQRKVFHGFGHLDFYLSGEAREPIWETLARFLDR